MDAWERWQVLKAESRPYRNVLILAAIVIAAALLTHWLMHHFGVT
jgi:multisubunit Na+/H+ antiporter MnhC subunit